MAQITDVIHGPKQIAERPVPVGCEQLPVTDGSFNDEDEDEPPSHSQQGQGLAICVNDLL